MVCAILGSSLPYSGKVWQGKSLANWLVSSSWWQKVWRINRSVNRLLITSTNLDGFSLANRGRIAKFTKPSPHQTFPLYNIVFRECATSEQRCVLGRIIHPEASLITYVSCKQIDLCIVSTKILLTRTNNSVTLQVSSSIYSPLLWLVIWPSTQQW